MEVIYLTVEDVEELHDYALELYGGLPGREPGKLEGALGIPMSGFFGDDAYPSLLEKAAAYYYFLASGHCFLDGNKRTSYLAAFTFLDINGFELIATDEDVFDFTLKIAQPSHERIPIFEVNQWLYERIPRRRELF